MTPSRSHRRICLAIAASVSALTTGAAATAAELNYQCVNAASGASWALTVDDQKHTVDGVPANITAARIGWRDPATGGLYDLDRKSGALTFTNPSSTGGYMLFHRCQAK